MAAADPIRNQKQLRQLAEYWLKLGNYRNHALIVLGTHTALRIGDLLSLKWDDVYDENRGEFRSHICIIERKTGKQKSIALNPDAAKTLRLHLPHRRGEYIFASNRKDEQAISRVQAWRLNPLEILYNEIDNYTVNVFHAMKCRKAWRDLVNLEEKLWQE